MGFVIVFTIFLERVIFEEQLVRIDNQKSDLYSTEISYFYSK